MFNVNVIGHLTVDKIFSNNTKVETLGGIANVWNGLLRSEINVNVNVIPTCVGEALIVVDTNTSNRTGRAVFNKTELSVTVPPADWHHIAYLNQIDNLDFLSTIDGGIVSADITKESPELCWEHLQHIDYLFISKEDLFDDIKILGSRVKQFVIAHDPHGSLYSDGVSLSECRLPPHLLLTNINVLGAGDYFAAAFIANSLSDHRPLHDIISTSHKQTTSYLKNT